MNIMTSQRKILLLVFLAATLPARAGTVFIEAEKFKTNGGWEVLRGEDASSASGLGLLDGSRGKEEGIATATVSIQDAGKYFIWVRYLSHPTIRGPFKLAVFSGGRELGSGIFDTKPEGRTLRDQGIWRSFQAVLPDGEVTLQLSKVHEGAIGHARLVDCILLTMNEKEAPNHLHFGAQTFVRVTLGEGYDRPTYIHIFADHFHPPWYKHFSLGRSGTAAAVSVRGKELLRSGQRTAWCNLTPMLYQDSGAMLHISARHDYKEMAPRLKATFEFATTADERSIVRTLNIDARPAGFAVYLPPNLLSKENRDRFKTDREIAEATGKLADAATWPTHGKKPEKFPFFVSTALYRYRDATDASIMVREKKTLDYFGFTGVKQHLSGLWFPRDGSYCNPDLDKMKEYARLRKEEFLHAGGDIGKLAYYQLTDEPQGQKLAFIAKDPSYREVFRTWLKKLGLSPADLLVADWQDVRLVTEKERERHPALYYFSQRFRTRALGDFMAIQRGFLEKEFGRSLPTLANFSDGATYNGNFYKQGVDYFELLDSPDQNAIWGEDWANDSSTYQCASFNVDLMRAAARERRQLIGHYLIAYADRKPWDVKLKATSELARGVRIMTSFFYGPSWASHEGGPYFRTHAMYNRPETWYANASIPREVGAVENELLKAAPAPAKVAILYSSSSDIWTIGDNLAYGFDRMHTWLALTHAQVPVDIVSEKQAQQGALDDYQVCYLSGPNLSRAAAEKLKDWVRKGGNLWLTAGAASRDEYNRPLAILTDMLPAERGPTHDVEKLTAAGRSIRLLSPKDRVAWQKTSAAVLSAKQKITPRKGTHVFAKFQDGSAAIVKGSAGKGRVYCAAFLPALSYVKPALDAKFELEKKVEKGDKSAPAEDVAILKRSANPWAFPAEIRELLLMPVRDAGVETPLACDIPLVDAVYMPHDQGILIPLANYTNKPIEKLTLRIQTPRLVATAESVLRGRIPFENVANREIVLRMPLDNNDYLKLTYR